MLALTTRYASTDSMTWEFSGMICLQFVWLMFASLSIGLVVGLFNAYFMKKAVSLTVSAVVECTILFGFAYTAYVVAEMLEFSGLVALLICGVT